MGLERAVFCTSSIGPIVYGWQMRTRRRYGYSTNGRGLRDSPLIEAASADRFLAQHGNSPIAPYIQLFAG